MSENLIQYVNAAQNGDTDAMAKLFSRTLKASFFLAEVLTAGDESAIDITKKAYAKAFCGIEKLKRPEAFEIWMKQNVAAAYKEGKDFSFAETESEAVEYSAEFLPEEAFEDEKKSAMIVKAVSTLAPEYRISLALHYNNGMPVAALAKFLGLSENSANALIAKAQEEILSYAGIDGAKESNGAMPVLTRIFQRAAGSVEIDNASVRDVFIYAIDAYTTANPAPEAPAEEVKEEPAPAPVAAVPDNVLSFKQKINEILSGESSSAPEEKPAEEKDEEELDVPEFVPTAPSAEAERAVEQFSSYENSSFVKKPEKKLPFNIPQIKLNPKFIAIACAALVVIIIIAVVASKAGDSGSKNPSTNDPSSAISANASGYDWRAGGFAECSEIIYLDENCAYFKSASTGKYGLLDYQGNVILQPHYEGFTRCGSGRDYSDRGSYHSLVMIGDEFYEFSVINGAVTIKDTPHAPHSVVADSFGDSSYEERDRYFEGYAAARKNGKWGYVSQDRDKKVIDYDYDAVNDLQASEAAACDYCRPVTDGYIAVKKGSMMGIIDLDGKTVVPFEYSNIMPGSNGVFIAQKSGTWGVILVGDAVTTFGGVNISVEPVAPDSGTDSTTTSSSSSSGRKTYRVTANGANIRIDAGASNEKIGEIKNGETVIGYDTKKAPDTGKYWVKIRYNGEYGWIAISNLEEV